MRRKIARLLVIGFALTVVLVGALFVRAKWVLDRSYAHLPLPKITADHSLRGVARGEMLFQTLCMECHGGADGRATGKHLTEVPGFLGTFYSANLAHTHSGVHQRSDGELARTLRTGVLPNGQFSFIMGMFSSLGDADVAALLGYVRSLPPALVPGGDVQPASAPSLVGKLLVTLAGAKVDDAAVRRIIPVPPRAPTVEYGRYMARTLDCVGCHTPGFSSPSEKMHAPDAFAGGVDLVDPTGATIWSRNITMDPETGIGRWTLADFERAVTRGVRPDDYLVRKPMPLFSRLGHVEIEALYKFLQTLPAVHRENTPGGHPLKKAQPGDTPETLFVSVGCAACHGENAPHRDRLRGARGKSEAAVASWILDPQAVKPGSIMPSFNGTLDRTQAEGLARYVMDLLRREGSPGL